MQAFEKEAIPEIINNPDYVFEPLLDDESLNNYTNKYEEGVRDIYDDAMRRHDNIVSTQIPLWAWALLIYISYKDIWRMITGHWIIILVFLSGTYALLKTLGLGGTPKMIYNMIKNQFNSLNAKFKMD